MVTFRNNNNNSNNRRNNFRRNDRNFKSNGDRPKFGSSFSNNENFKRKVPGRNNHNAAKLIDKYNNLATICVKRHEITIPFGVINCEGIELKRIEEKPSYEFLINAGVYVIDPILLSEIPENTYFDMPTFLQEAKESNKKISVCPIFEYWIDIGRPETLKEANISWGEDF